MRLRGGKLLLVGIAVYAVARFCHHQTAGFKMSKVRENCAPEACQLSSSPPPEEVQALLQGRFSYFGRGLQSFAFLSEGGDYVLKLFNNRSQRRLFWMGLIGQKERSREIEQKLEQLFHSYRIASEELAAPTATLYFHPTPTTGCFPTVTLVDKLGIEHAIDLDKTGFLLQKRATLAYPWLKHLLEEGRSQEAREAISALVTLFVEKSQRGIADHDPLIRTNFGFVEGCPVQIDVGSLSKDPSVRSIEVFLPELKRVMASLRHWLETYGPELIEHLDALLEEAEKTAKPTALSSDREHPEHTALESAAGCGILPPSECS